MVRNKVMTLWTTIVTAFLALCTALGFVTTTASAAVPQSGTHSNTESASPETAPTVAIPRPRSRTGSLPPTMKQRIRAEAHGKAPSCRHRPAGDATATATGLLCDDDTAESETRHPGLQHTAPIQR
ncbi:hypothetical protein GCM10010385_01410 [Streptomyces geysiriensis]|uniref:DUF6344 domain-containing protein n=1 Tax=Streptomyces TaxID=1883 RepID=UPI000FB3257C|nr:DUF6344 domain-containing protein [Streptomyces sp. WAC06128]RSS70574.1 hypothetical protein EF911_28730 [Streptomyces sp. WAC06128]GGY56329.1 hypothetical protein GCM10010385_01410 [Streptomyces geysiriensis]